MSSKCLIIHGCIEGVCPYFKRTHHYDYNDELTCTHPQIKVGYEEDHIHDYEYQEEYKPGKYKTLPANCGEEGLFPVWCKLEDK